MTVTVQDVRVALNNISEEELSSETIQQKISEAELIFSDVADSPKKDFVIRSYAAYHSFLVSKTYSSFKVGTLSAKREVEIMAAALRLQYISAVIELKGIAGIVKSTKMYDDAMLKALGIVVPPEAKE